MAAKKKIINIKVYFDGDQDAKEGKKTKRLPGTDWNFAGSRVRV